MRWSATTASFSVWAGLARGAPGEAGSAAGQPRGNSRMTYSQGLRVIVMVVLTLVDRGVAGFRTSVKVWPAMPSDEGMGTTWVRVVPLFMATMAT